MSSTPSTEQIAARWSAHADRYHRWGDLAHGHPDYRRAWVDVLADLVGHPCRDGSPALRIADVGTGTAEIALLLAEMGHDVTGYDIAPGMLERVMAKAGTTGAAVRFARGDAYDLPLGDATVDVVINRMVFWTLYDPPEGVFWATQDRLERARDRFQHRGSDTLTSQYRCDAVQPPGMSWQSVADAQRHFTEADLRDVTQGWLDTVFDVHRRTASLGWRLAGGLPRFFTLTWQQR